MEVINESLKIENKEMLPQILLRIFSVCKADPNFQLKEKMDYIDNEVDEIELKISKQNKLVQETIDLRDNLSERLQLLRQDNFELKSRLLEELGSEI